MNLTQEDYDILQKYIKDALGEKDKMLFDERIKDPDFRKELWDQVKTLEAVEEVETEKLKDYFKSIDKNKSITHSRNIETKQRTLTVTSLLKYAAVLTGLLITAYFINVSILNKVDNKELFAEYYQTYPAKVFERGNSDNDQTKFNLAMEQYRERNYDSCLNTLMSISDLSEDVSIYKSSCLMELKDFDKAEAILNELIKSNNEENLQVAEWNLALIYLRKNKTTNAKIILEKISKDVTHLYNRKAFQLFYKI